jgi:hypothetical protein
MLEFSGFKDPSKCMPTLNEDKSVIMNNKRYYTESTKTIVNATNLVTKITFTGSGLVIRFTDHFNTRLVTTLNYSANANLHTLQITISYAKYLQLAVSSLVVPW